MKKLFVLTFALFSVFASCSNLDGGSSAGLLGSLAGGTQNAGANSARFVTVSGSLALTGAVPEEISAPLCHAELVSASNNISKTAFPTVPAATELSCDVKAVNVDDETEYYTGTATGLSSYTVSIPAAAATKSYKIKVEASLVVESVKAGVALSGQSEEFPVTQESPLVSQDVSLKPVSTSGGYGILDIAINVRESGISYARATIQYSALEEETLYASPSGSGILTFKQGEMKTTGVYLGIKAGSWPVTFDFYSGDDTSSPKVYSFKETINIFNNLTTSKWGQNGGEPWFETSGSGSSKSTGCHVTAEMVSAFAVSDFYVDPTVTSSGSGIAPWSAKKTLSEALALLKNVDTDYTIYIKGELKENDITIPDTLKKTKSSGDASDCTYAKSLVLCGAQGLNEYGVPQDSVKPVLTSGKRALTVTSGVPLTIRNLMVTGGYPSDNGGGILLSVGKLTLDSGAVVTGNKTENKGGGICVMNGTLVINDGAEISGNIISSDSPGGGVYIEGGSLEMNGGAIKNNLTLGEGGGVFCKESSFTMNGGVIGEDGKGSAASSADNARSNKAEKGGGVYFNYNGNPSKQLNLLGGKIAWNYAAYDGGGIYMNYGTATIKASIDYNGAARYGGGIFVYSRLQPTVNLEDCSIVGNEVSAGFGGAIFVDYDGDDTDVYWWEPVITLKGAVKIPCPSIDPSVKKKNDIYFQTAEVYYAYCISSLQIAGSLSGSETIRITIPDGEDCANDFHDWPQQILKLADGVTDTSLISQLASRIVVSTTDPSHSWYVDSSGNLKY